jgi:putative secretion ATPase (PEP-CTERM system associated)
MYEKFYNLRERPFALSPDPEYLYLSRVHREALDSLRYGIESRAGFIVVTGEIGAGKTTLLQTLLQRLDDRATVARVVNTTLDPRELLEAIALDFGLDTLGRTKPLLLRELGQFLVEQRSAGRRPLLVIDEAQNLSSAALEEVRLLSNLETEKSKLLQILLVGQPDLRDKIASPELEQFRQRVAVSYHLTALDEPDTTGYIQYRLAHAALGTPPAFSDEAAALVHRASGGVPRIVNVICDAALVFGYAEERPNIDLPLLQEVLGELKTTGVLPGHVVAEAVPSRPVEVALPPAPPRPKPAALAVAPAPAPAPVQARPDVRTFAEQPFARAVPSVDEQGSRLAAREQAIVKRERELAEQRRIMAEEYRLLHQLRSQPAAVAAGGTTRGTHRATGGAQHSAFSPEPRGGLLGWLKRILTGGSPPAVEGR